MIRYTIYTSTCPGCGDYLCRGVRRFGPAKVRCGHCDEVVPTGLDDWDALTLPRKTILSIGELMLPSWMGVSGCNGVFVAGLMQMFLWTIGMVPFTILATSLPVSAEAQSWLMILGFAVYPLLLFWRLARMILESTAYTRGGRIAVWKHGSTSSLSKHKTVNGRKIFWIVLVAMSTLAVVLLLLFQMRLI